MWTRMEIRRARRLIMWTIRRPIEALVAQCGLWPGADGVWGLLPFPTAGTWDDVTCITHQHTQKRHAYHDAIINHANDGGNIRHAFEKLLL